MQIDPSQALTIFVGNLPTFTAVILAWMHSNSRTSDMRSSLEGKINDKFEILSARIDQTNLKIDKDFDILNQKIDKNFVILNQKIDHTVDILRADLHRVEEVMDARLKHLEEHER